jgi:hypothetical protein
MSTATLEAPAVTSAQKQGAPWIALTFCALILFVFSNALVRPTGQFRVFGSFWSSGWNLSHAQNPYASGPLTWHIKPYLHRDVEVVDFNGYPPELLPFFSLLSKFNPESALRVWMYLSALALLLCAVLLRGRWYQIVWFALCAPVIDTLLTMQIYPFLALLFVFAWLLLKHGRQIAAGVLIGFLIALKPNFGLWPVFLFFTAYRKASVSAFISCAFFSIAPIFFYGPRVYAEWIASMSSLSGNHYIFPTNVSVVALAHSIGHPHIGQIAALCLIGVSLYLILRKRADLVTASGLALTLGILASPIGWIHYVLFLLPVLFAAPWRKKLTCAMLFLLIPATIACGVVMNHSPAATLVMRCAYMLPIALLWCKFAHRQIGSEVIS